MVVPMKLWSISLVAGINGSGTSAIGARPTQTQPPTRPSPGTAVCFWGLKASPTTCTGARTSTVKSAPAATTARVSTPMPSSSEAALSLLYLLLLSPLHSWQLLFPWVLG